MREAKSVLSVFAAVGIGIIMLLGCEDSGNVVDSELAKMKSLAQSLPDEVTMNPLVEETHTSRTAIGELKTSGGDFLFEEFTSDLSLTMALVSSGISWVKDEIESTIENQSELTIDVNELITITVGDITGDYVTIKTVKYMFLDESLTVWISFGLNYMDSLLMDFEVKLIARTDGYQAKVAIWEDGDAGLLDIYKTNRYWTLNESYVTGEISMLEFVKESHPIAGTLDYATWNSTFPNSDTKMDFSSFKIADEGAEKSGLFMLNRPDYIYIAEKHEIQGTRGIAAFETDLTFIGAIEAIEVPEASFELGGNNVKCSDYESYWPADWPTLFDTMKDEATAMKAAGQIAVDAEIYFPHAEFDGF